MTGTGEEVAENGRRDAVFARLPTGAKVFLILSAALLPLAIIAMFATLQSTRIEDLEARSRLRVAIAESSRALAIELRGDITALRTATDSLTGDATETSGCARVQGIFGDTRDGPRFAIIGRNGRLVCGTNIEPALLPPPPEEAGVVAVRITPGRGLALLAAPPTGDLLAMIWFPRDYLARIARPSGFMPYHGSILESRDGALVLETMDQIGALDRQEAVRAPIGVGDLSLTMTVRRAALTASQVVAASLPLLMWAAAAGIGWFVVDRLLIRPLRELRGAVAAYRPGGSFPELRPHALPALEIAALGETFRAITRTVALHEADLAEGLNRQTKLTREVHHRVKNNLQVIASLINFHARSAVSPDAAQAYASIQRRVDALAVVHRNHFAEIEETRGLGLRSVIGELASNIRATAPDDSSDMAIALDLEPFLVTQDVAIAVAFLLTELVELALSKDPSAQIQISLRPAEAELRATLRVSSPALIEDEALQDLIATRYGRVMEGLSRQLRSKLHHEPLSGGFEIVIAVTGKD